MKKLRMAIIGIEHCHVRGMINEFKEKAEIVGIAEYKIRDEKAYEMYKEVHLPKDVDIEIWDDYKELLSQDIDVAVICTNVKDHADIACEILDMGIHVIVEKPMAIDMNDAKRMYRAYKKSKAELIISWPIAWFSTFNKVKELADSGIVGDIQRVQYRSPSTRGAYSLEAFTDDERSHMWWYQRELGGGSIFDYTGYGCVLTAWITGRLAKKVFGMKKNFFLPYSDVEDYSVFSIDFGDCVGLIEGSWSTMSNGQIPTGPVVYGSEGVIVADRFDKKVKVYKTYKPYVPTPDPEYVYDVENSKTNLADNVIAFITNGVPLHEIITAEFNMKAAAILDAGRRSCESGTAEWADDPFQF